MFTLGIVILLGFLIASTGLLLGPLWLNRRELPPGNDQNKCTKHKSDIENDPRKIPRPNDSIKIIRLTNSGEFVDRCDLTNALYELNWDRERPAYSFGVEVKAEAPKLPKLTLLYIHGWKHDGTPEDSDLRNFTRLIEDLRDRHKGEKYVVGIYVGWDAKAGLPGLFENVSFWVKKTNADRIAQSAVVTKIVSAIGAITRAAPDGLDQFIAIGHSFGARVLFSATAQSFVYETERSHPGFPGGEYQLVKGAADAVILLNPAFEASRYTAIDDITRRDERFSPSQPPLLLCVSTDNDWATKIAYPMGQWLGLARSRRELSTLGNYSPYFTHTLVPNTDGTAVVPGEAHMTEDFVAAGLRLTRLSRGAERRVVQAHNPFVIATTTKDVIDGHNGIWSETFRTWLGQAISALEKRYEAKASLSGSKPRNCCARMTTSMQISTDNVIDRSEIYEHRKRHD